MKFIAVWSSIAGIIISMESWATRCAHCKDAREDCFNPVISSKERIVGAWKDPGMPKRRWTCISVEDMGARRRLTCGMCGKEKVRYVHYMRHGSHRPPVIGVGPRCASLMSLSENPKESEAVHRTTCAREALLDKRLREKEFFQREENWTLAQEKWTVQYRPSYSHRLFSEDMAFCVGIQAQAPYSMRIAMMNRVRVGEEMKWVVGERSRFEVSRFSSLVQAKKAAFDYMWPPRQTILNVAS